MQVDNRGGSLSIGGLGGWPIRCACNAAKAGVIVLTELLATEWAHHGIRLSQSRLLADRDTRVTRCGLKPRLESSVTDTAAMVAYQLCKAAAK